MADHPNAVLLRGAFQATSEADVAALTGTFEEDMVGHVGGDSPFSGDHRGRDVWFGLLRRLGELTGGTWKSEVHDIVANDGHAVTLTRVRASRDGKQLDLLGAQVYHVIKGKITEAWWFWQDQRAFDEFWK